MYYVYKIRYTSIFEYDNSIDFHGISVVAKSMKEALRIFEKNYNINGDVISVVRDSEVFIDFFS